MVSKLSPTDRFETMEQVKLPYPCDYFEVSRNSENLQLAFVNTHRENSELKILGRVKLCVYPDLL